MPLFGRKSSAKKSQRPTSGDLSSGLTGNGSAFKRMPSCPSGQSDDIANGHIGQSPQGKHGSKRPKHSVFSFDDVCCGDPNLPYYTSSRLSKTFLEILHDKDALPYFIQFMETCSVGNLIRFWLDAESFQAAALSRIRTHSLNTLKQRGKSTSTGCSDHLDCCSTSAASRDTGQVPLPVDLCNDSLSTEESSSLHHCISGSSNIYSAKSINNVSLSQNISVHKTEDLSHACCSPTVLSIQGCDNGVIKASVNSGNVTKAECQSTDHQLCDGDALHCDVLYKGAHLLNSVTVPLADDEQTQSCENVDSNNTTDDSYPGSNTTSNAVSPAQSTALPVCDKNIINTVSDTFTVDSENGIESTCSGQQQSASSSQSESSRKEDFNLKLIKSIERDAVTIYTRYLCKDATHSVNIPEELRNDAISKICQEDGQVDPQCFVSSQKLILDIMEREHYTEFIGSVFHYKHQIDVLTSGQVYLADIFYNEQAIFYFMEYVEQEQGSELLALAIAADNFQQHLQTQLESGGYDGMEAQTDAMVLYDKYFSLQASKPLGFSDTVRFEVESNICREAGPLPDCFATPKNLALKKIDKEYFPGFLRSDQYYKYLSDLVNTIQMAQDLPTQKKLRRSSDTSSEYSAGSHSTGAESVCGSSAGVSGASGTRNTLLATADLRHYKHALKSVEPGDMQIDMMLFNPDALWQRPNTGKMSFGKIDKMGQFVSEFEGEPDRDKKKGSLFFKKNADKSKEEEDMALRIAQMIISDVTASTQQPPSPHATTRQPPSSHTTTQQPPNTTSS